MSTGEGSQPQLCSGGTRRPVKREPRYRTTEGRKDSAGYISRLQSLSRRKQNELEQQEHLHTALLTWEAVLQTSITGMGCGILQNIGSSLTQHTHGTAEPRPCSDEAGPPLLDVLSMEVAALSKLAEAGVISDQESQLYTCTRLRAIAGTPLIQHVQTASAAELGAALSERVKRLAVLLYKSSTAADAGNEAAQDTAGDLEALVDEFVDLALAIFFYALDKAFEISSINWETHEQCSAPSSHWAAAARRLQHLLEPKQEQQLVLGYRMFAKRRAVLLEEQQQLLCELQQKDDKCSDEAQAQQEQFLRWQQLQHGNSSRAQQLSRNVEALKVISQDMWVLTCNLLTRRQLAEFLVHCFPWQPCALPVMEILSAEASPETQNICKQLNWV